MRISRRQFALAGIGAAASPSVVSAIATAINHQESSNPSYNNPGDLRYAGQAGATGAAPNGMAIFSSLQAGQQAEVDQIQKDVEAEVEAAAAFAEASPEPALDTLYQYIYAQPVANMQIDGSLIGPATVLSGNGKHG